jgi:cytochrome c oxidase cbb3-type subunit I
MVTSPSLTRHGLVSLASGAAHMHSATASAKKMTTAEGATAGAFAVLAFLSIIIAGGAHTSEYAFHAFLFAAGSAATVFAVVNRYFDRPSAPAPLEIDGKPNYNMGPVKFATIEFVEPVHGGPDQGQTEY